MINRFSRAIVLVALCLILVPSAQSADALTPTHRVELFNGHDLTGWKAVAKDGNASGTWRVEGDVIKCAGKPVGYLRTEQSYRDYRLTVEWRFTKMAPKADNTGVLVHIQLPDHVWPTCVQCQGKHLKQGDLFLMNGAESKEHTGMDANTPVPMRGESHEKPVGEWNTCELVCHGTTVQAYVNGTLMNEVTACTVSAGCIGFQAERAEMEIRKVFLTPLAGE